MCLDLTLLPFHNDADFSLTVLPFARGDEGLFEAISEIVKASGRDVPERFMSYVSRAGGKDSHFGVTAKDSYGDPLKYVTAGDLRDVVVSKCNRPVMAFVKALPRAAKIAVYWH